MSTALKQTIGLQLVGDLSLSRATVWCPWIARFSSWTLRSPIAFGFANFEPCWYAAKASLGQVGHYTSGSAWSEQTRKLPHKRTSCTLSRSLDPQWPVLCLSQPRIHGLPTVCPRQYGSSSATQSRGLWAAPTQSSWHALWMLALARWSWWIAIVRTRWWCQVFWLMSGQKSTLGAIKPVALGRVSPQTLYPGRERTFLRSYLF